MAAVLNARRRCLRIAGVAPERHNTNSTGAGQPTRAAVSRHGSTAVFWLPHIQPGPSTGGSILDLRSELEKIGERARSAQRRLQSADSAAKDSALRAMAEFLRRDADNLQRANRKDLRSAEEAGKDAAFIDRLRLDEARIEAMARGLEEIAALPDPVGEITDLRMCR